MNDRAWLTMTLSIWGCSIECPPGTVDIDGQCEVIAGDGGPCAQPATSYRDQDGDGYGVDDDTRESCAPIVGYVEHPGDCDDADELVNPAADDPLGDCADQDCNLIDAPDNDLDGYRSMACGGEDCDDGERAVSPGATDEVGNGMDDNCDGLDGVDADGDGWAATASGGDDCEDLDDSINPGVINDEWEIDIVAAGFRPSAAVDLAGVVHVAYFVGETVALSYSSNAGGAWAVELQGIDAATRLAPRAAIAVDRDGTVHLSYFIFETDVWRLFHTRVSDDSEGSSSVDVVTVDAPYSSLQLEANGSAHIVYARREELVHATSTEGDAVLVSLVPLKNDGRSRPSAAIDGALLRIAYDDLGELLLATSDAEDVVTIDRIDASFEGEAAQPALAIDSGGALHVAYYGGDDLRYATLDPSDPSDGWRVESVGPASTRDDGTSIALGPDGAVHIAYKDDVRGEVLYATNQAGAWHTESVDFAAVVPNSPSIVVDSEGVVHIVYASDAAVDWEVRYATRPPSDGIDNDCDGITW